ncbi:hypothetical protein P4679_23415 [Priestia megaterium]|uniref:hypothetical protein n=1 Tax=Priestia megaterium TaxID=1404 RepID=UPI002E1B8F24|nr:hypothetical protein [Priestia megaterium]
MSELMNVNGYVLDNDGEPRLSRKVTYNKETLKKKKLQEKEGTKNKNQDQGTKDDSMHKMVKRVDGCGANRRKGEAANVRKEFSLPEKERKKKELLDAVQKLSSVDRPVNLDSEIDSMGDTRINRRKLKTSLLITIGKELLLALTNPKKKAGVLNK